MTIIVYEQPVNELVRVCLRLEHVFKKIDRLLAPPPMDNCAQLIGLMIDVINLLDRPDLKSKLTQELYRNITALNKLNHYSNISQKKLNDTLKQLERLLEYFVNLKGKICNPLKENEFIANIRMRRSSPSTECSFEIPAYYNWLQQPKENCIKEIKTWLVTFKEAREATDLLLFIIRQSAEPIEKTAENGFYSESINLQTPIQLIRVSFDDELNLYPEISAGKHRLSIRYFSPNANERPSQTSNDVPFQLNYCCIQ